MSEIPLWVGLGILIGMLLMYPLVWRTRQPPEPTVLEKENRNDLDEIMNHIRARKSNRDMWGNED